MSASSGGSMDGPRRFPAQETAKPCSPESTELTRTKMMARELARQIEEANARASRHRFELQATKRSFRRPKLAGAGYAGGEMEEAMRELRRMRLSVKSAMDAKKKAEDELAAWAARRLAGELALEEMRKEMADADEEYAIVELARIEAEKELREIDAQRAAEAARFAGEIAAARKKIKALQRDAKRGRELAAKLVAAESDVAVLRGEMEMVRAMDDASPPPAGAAAASVEAELRQAKKELAEVKGVGFRLMATMDAARTEMSSVERDAGRLREKERRAEDAMQRLNAKLLKAKSQLQSAIVGDERATAILANLTSALQQLKTDVATAKDEKAASEEEAAAVRAVTGEVLLEVAAVESALAARVRELKAGKAAEAAAMRRLKNAVERTATAAAGATMARRSAVTISKFEYEYLTRQVDVARAVAEKKAAGAAAWVEAIKASEREIALRAEHVMKEIKDVAAKQDRRDAAAAGGAAEEEELTESTEEEEEEGQRARKPRRESRASRRVRLRRVSVTSSSSLAAAAAAAQLGRSPSVSLVRQRRAGVPSLMKLIPQRRSKPT